MINWREVLVILLSNIAVITIAMSITVIVQRNSCEENSALIEKCCEDIKEAKH